MTRIMAIDQARQCGWAWTDGVTIESGSWNLSALSPLPMGQLDMLYRNIAAIHKRLGIDQIVYEKPAMGHNDRAASASSEKIGVLKLLAFRINAVCERSYAPASVKKFATGNGRAEKHEMIQACFLKWGKVPRDDNEADALWLMQMALEKYEPGKVEKPKKQPPKSLPGQLPLFGKKPRRVIRNDES